jgi:hypothetical protein
MPLYYHVIAQVFPAQGCRVRVVTHIAPQYFPQAPPAPSLTSIGNFHTLRRSFPTKPLAAAWTEHLHITYTKGPTKNPTIKAPIFTDDQLLLFDFD